MKKEFYTPPYMEFFDFDLKEPLCNSIDTVPDYNYDPIDTDDLFNDLIV